MKPLRVLAALSAIVAFPVAAFATDDFYGLIESRPAGAIGTWVIGGRQVTVTERTKFDDDDGPLAVNACVEVDYDGGAVEEIETEKASKCR